MPPVSPRGLRSARLEEEHLNAMGARYILAMVLMIAVMLTWSLLFGKRFAPQPEEPATTEQTETPDTQEIIQPIGGVETSPLSPDSFAPILESPDDAKVHVQTGNYHVTFNEKFAIAKQWELAHFADRAGTTEAPLNLIPADALSCLALRFRNAELESASHRAIWQADKSEIDIANAQAPETLTFTTIIGKKLHVAKQFTFYPDTYTAELVLKFRNVSDAPLLMGNAEPGSGYELRWGAGINADLLRHEKKSGKRGRHGKEGAKTILEEGNPIRELKEEQALATVLWAALDSQYFSAVMIPDPGLEATYLLDASKTADKNDIQTAAPTETAVLAIPLQLASQQEATHAFRLYVGPKDDALLKQVTAPNAPDKSVRLSKIIDFGFFWFVAWGMLWIFEGLHAIFQNYGIAIILLTALMKVASYPLTRKAHVSMKKMQSLQPQLAELKEKYRDDPQKLNRATMRLYKEEGVNPLGGCMPMLPQLPIFWALFSLLGSAVELRGAPFMLWIDDLSAPDVLFELPFTIPLIFTEIDAVRFLPLLNGLTTWLQQKVGAGMTPAPTGDNMQAKLMQFMPLLFVFLFYNWASGFVLYWLCNNVFTMAQQYLQTRYSDDEAQLAPASNKRTNTPRRKRN